MSLFPFPLGPFFLMLPLPFRHSSLYPFLSSFFHVPPILLSSRSLSAPLSHISPVPFSLVSSSSSSPSFPSHLFPLNHPFLLSRFPIPVFYIFISILFTLKLIPIPLSSTSLHFISLVINFSLASFLIHTLFHSFIIRFFFSISLFIHFSLISSIIHSTFHSFIIYFFSLYLSVY